MERYARGTDITVRWTLDLDSLEGYAIVFEYFTGAGKKTVSWFTISGSTIVWEFDGADQFVYGVYGLRATISSGDDASVEFREDKAFEIIHGTPASEPATLALSASIEIEAEEPEEEDDEEEEEASEYVSHSPAHIEKVPIGSNITLFWKLLTPPDFDFDIESCDLHLYYDAAGSGRQDAQDYTLITEDGYKIQWNFAAEQQNRYGAYNLFLELTLNGALVSTLVREDAFILVHRRGSANLANRVIEFESVVTSVGAGALHSLLDVLNDGYSTVFRPDGETHAASGDLLMFGGAKWYATNAIGLSLASLEDSISGLSGRMAEYDLDLDGISDLLSVLRADVDQNTAWIQEDEEELASLVLDARGLHASVTDIYGNLASMELTATQFQTRISNAEGDISTLTQTANAIDMRVSDAEGNIGSLTLTAQSLASRLLDAEGNVSTLQQTATALTSAISDANGNISTLQQTATALTSAISDANGNISTLQQTATALTSALADTNGNVSLLQQTATGLQYQVSSQASDIATLQVSARGLTSRVSDAEGNISVLEQTASGLQISVSSLQTDVTSIGGTLNNYISSTDATIASMQHQLDNAIETWFYNGAPSLLNQPAVNWTTDSERNVHLGDLYYDKLTGYAYRFMVDTSGSTNVYSWGRITDSDVTLALQNAAFAQATADGKLKMFLDPDGTTPPVPPYHLGDLWVKSDGTIYKCTTEKAENQAFASGDWSPSDFASGSVMRANFDVLANAIIGTVAAYDADGNITSATATQFAQSIDNISFSVSKVGSALLPTGINISDQLITIRSDNFVLAGNGVGSPAALTLTYRDDVPYISAANIDVTGVFTTSAWSSKESALQRYADSAAGTAETNAKNYAESSGYLNNYVLPVVQGQTAGLAVESDYSYLKTALANQTTALGGLLLTSLIQLGATENNTSWTVRAGISGIYDSTKTGYGIGAWFGGPMVDLADHLADNPIPSHAKTVFRMDGSGYLADRAIFWSDQGDLHLNTNIVLGDTTPGNPTINSILTFMAKFGSWFVEDTTTMSGKTLLRINMGSQQSTGFDGLIFDGFLITGGDQIIENGTPGGGGTGGAGYLYELGDVYHDNANTKVLRDPDYAATTGQEAQAGDVLVLDSTYGWAAVPSSALGVTSLVSSSANGLAPAYSSANQATSSSSNTYYFLGWTGSTMKWYSLPANAFNNTEYSAGAGSTANSDTTNRVWSASALNSFISTQGYTKNAGTVTSVKVGTTSYSPSSGVVSLPAYPTTLDEVTDGTTRKLSNYLPLAGGTIANSGIYNLYLNNTASDAAATGIRFYLNGTLYGALFVYNNGNLYYAPNGGSGQAVWHEGNFTPGDYLSRAGGAMSSSSAAISWGASNDRTDWDTFVNGIRLMSSIVSNSGAPTQYAVGVNIKCRYGMEIAAGATADDFYMRREGHDWCILLHHKNFVAGTDYMSISGTETSTGTKTFSNSAYGGQLVVHRNNANYDSTIKFTNVTDGVLGYIGMRGSYNGIAPIYSPDGSNDYNLWHSGNSNLSTVDWTCKNLTANYVHAGSGSSVTPLELFGSSSGSAIGFYKSGTRTALLYSDTVDGPLTRYKSDWSAGYTIWDAGNSGTRSYDWNCANLYSGSSSAYIEIAHDNEINQYASGTPLYLNYRVTGNIFMCVGGGNVGIGTETATMKLRVYGGACFGNASNGICIAAKPDGTETGAYDCIERAGSGNSLFIQYYNTGGLSVCRGGGNMEVGAATQNAYRLNVGGSAIIEKGTGSATIGPDVFGLIVATSGARITTAGSYYPGIAFKHLWNLRSGNPYAESTQAWIGIKLASTAGTENSSLVFAVKSATGTGDNYPVERAVLDPSGNFSTTGDQVVSSDATLKTNIQPVTYSVADIAKAHAVSFDWKDGRGHSVGSIAQDWKPICPELVHGEEGNMTLAYGQLALVNTILLARQSESHEERIKRLERIAEDHGWQEGCDMIERLEEENEAYRKENIELKKEVERLRMN